MADDKSQVKARFVFNGEAEDDTSRIAFHIRRSDNAIGRVLESKIPALINDYTHRQWRDLVTKELVDFIDEGALAVIPVVIGQKPIGVICAQYFPDKQFHLKGKNSKQSKTKKEITQSDFDQLCSLVDHLNLCITMIMMR